MDPADATTALRAEEGIAASKLAAANAVNIPCLSCPFISVNYAQFSGS